MKVLSVFIVKIEDRSEVLYALEDGTFYIGNGSLAQITTEDATKLLE